MRKILNKSKYSKWNDKPNFVIIYHDHLYLYNTDKTFIRITDPYTKHAAANGSFYTQFCSYTTDTVKATTPGFRHLVSFFSSIQALNVVTST